LRKKFGKGVEKRGEKIMKGEEESYQKNEK
jgi:hypothetical protein